MTTVQGNAFDRMLTEPRPEYVEIGQNRWSVVRSHGDGSAILATYGTRPTRESAEALAERLADLGVDGNLTVVPFYATH